MSAFIAAGPAAPDDRRYPTRKLLLLALAGAIAGAAVGYGVTSGLRALHITRNDVGWTDILALWIGVFFLGYSLFFAYLSTNRRQLALILEGEQATVPATNDELLATRLQTVVLALAGLLLLAPIFVQKLLPRHAALGAETFAVIVLLFAVQTWANVRLWQTSDEFSRRLIAGGAAVSFAVVQGALFLWAAAEHLHLVRPMPAWNLYTLLMLLYLLASAAFTLRQNRCV
jgi:hypothetical protein